MNNNITYVHLYFFHTANNIMLSLQGKLRPHEQGVLYDIKHYYSFKIF